MNTSVKKIFALRINTCNNNIGKRWHIAVKVPDYINGCFVWKKCYGDINKYRSIEERLAECGKLYKQIENTQQIPANQGSRKPGITSHELFYTDVIYQVTQHLENEKAFLRPASYRKYSGYIKNITRWLQAQSMAKMPVGAFTNEHAVKFLQSVKGEMLLSNNSYNGHLSYFKSIFARFIEVDIIKKNPFAGIKSFPKQSVPPLYFQRNQIEILKCEISKRDPELWFFVQFIYYCFIRPGELRQLKIEDIIFESGQIYIPGSVSKNKRGQYVLIPTVLLKELLNKNYHMVRCKNYYIFGKDGMPGDHKLATNEMKTRHQDILKSLEFSTRHKLYSWKHTGAIMFAKAGGSLKDLQLQLRHHSLDQVDAYLKGMGVHESNFVKNKFPKL